MMLSVFMAVSVQIPPLYMNSIVRSERNAIAADCATGDRQDTAGDDTAPNRVRIPAHRATAFAAARNARSAAFIKYMAGLHFLL